MSEFLAAARARVAAALDEIAAFHDDLEEGAAHLARDLRVPNRRILTEAFSRLDEGLNDFFGHVAPDFHSPDLDGACAAMVLRAMEAEARAPDLAGHDRRTLVTQIG